jgi:DNA-binding transcriptional ArsR family regulator
MSENEEEGAAEAGPAARKVRRLDPRSLRGIAHPLRMRLLTVLRQDGPATASRLAEKLGESSGATSYHLRQLAAHGFVEDDPERGKGRERWWKAAVDGTLFDESLYSDPDPAVRGAADLYLHEHATMHTQEVATWLGSQRDWPEAQALELNEKIHELIESYRDLEPAPGTEGAAQVRLHTHAFPRSTD